jgi:DNA-binding PadR family transcriptional regulator
MTDAELTILSLVAEGAQYGHQIQQIIDERGLREWITVGFSSVYYILNKLEEKKLVSSNLQMEGGRLAHKAYTLTPAGRGVLQTAIADLLRQPRSLGTGFELGLVNLSVLTPGQVYEVLSYHHHDLAYRLQAVEQSWEESQQNNGDHVNDHIQALYTHSIALMTAELAWLTDFLAHWKQRYPAVDRSGSIENTDDDSSAVTQVHFNRTHDPAQMIQRLKKPGTTPPEAEDENS